jgi:hypothetical protein
VVNNPSNEIMFCLPVCVVHYGHGIAIPNWLPCGLAVKYALGAPEEKEDKDKEGVSDSSARGGVLQALNGLKQPCGQPACQPTQGLYHQHGQPKGVKPPDARQWEDASVAEARSYEGEQEERKLALSMCPFRFRWQENNGQFFRYPDEYSRQLNIAYEQGESATVLKSVVRFLDDQPQDYRIDFKTMTQMNTSSRYVRRIDREMIDQGPVECMFEYLNEHNAWVAYDTTDQAHINQAFNAYRLGGPGTVSMHLAGRPEIYRLNFAAAKQTNMNSNTDRSMRRR